MPSRKNVTSGLWLVRMRLLGEKQEREKEGQELPPKFFPKEKSQEHGSLAEPGLPNRLQAS